jgi:hypothetical protein
MSSLGGATISACLLAIGCVDFDRLSEECKAKNGVRRVSSAEPWVPPADTRTALALLADSPDLLARVTLASNTAGLNEQLRKVELVSWLIEDSTADANDRLVGAFQEVEAAAATGARRTAATATALAFVLREREVKAAIPHLARALERRLHAPEGVPITFFLMTQNALWELLGKPKLPTLGLVQERVFLIDAARR